MTPERKAELRAVAVEALNEPIGTRPPYGDTGARFDLATARRVLERIEHAEASQENEDRLFVELRAACAEVEILRSSVQAMPELLDALDARDALDSELAANRERVRSVVSCPVHEGSFHGGEAEELRAGIEKIIGDLDLDIDHEAKVQLQRLLDAVDARDSLGHLERGDIVADLRTQVANRDRSIESLTSRTSELLGMVASLRTQHDADAARIAGLEAAANRRLTERDARIDEVAAEAQSERAKREHIEAAAREVLDLRDRYGVLTITGEWTRADAAINALRIALGGGS